MLVGTSLHCGTLKRIPTTLTSLVTQGEKTLPFNGSVNYSAYLVNDSLHELYYYRKFY